MPDWDDPDTVAFFRDRPPDHRLTTLVEAGALPCGARVLDLGCAAGRNAAYLTSLEVDVLAIDASAAMVAATRERLAPFVGPEEAVRRVWQARFADLDGLPDASFDLVVALGVLQHARDDAEFEAGVATIARVLRPAGQALVAHFSPASTPYGRRVEHVAGTRHVYRGWGDEPKRTSVLHDPLELDVAFAAHGLEPVTATVAVARPRKPSAGADDRRTTCNAHYRRASP